MFPTTQTITISWPDDFLLAKKGAGPTLARCCSTNEIQKKPLTVQFFMLAQRCPYVVKPTQEKVSLSNFYVAHDDIGPTLIIRCAPNDNYQSTVIRLSGKILLCMPYSTYVQTR